MGVFAHGTTLTLGSDLIAELTNVSGPTIAVDTIDVTSHDSADKFREFVAGLKDGGEISVEGNLITAVQGNLILTNVASGDEEDVIITFGDGPATFTCKGFATAFEPGAPHDDKLSFSATFKITGKPVLA
jgi:predicted secreted protein